MPRQTWDTRSDFWPPWVPKFCPNLECGRELLPVVVHSAWMHCDCAGTTETRGHNVWFCRCHQDFWPPEHVPGSETPEPPRV